MSIIDVHVHLAGVGSGNDGCLVSPRMRRSLVFKFLKRVVRLDPDDPVADRLYADRLAALVEGAEYVDRVVLLSMDGVYDQRGHLDRERSHLFVPNEHLFETCARHPVFLPGASVNPGRRDALEELERCAAGGAVLIKWLAPLQLFDPSLPSFKTFYRTLARLRLPLLAHSGCEHTFPDMNQHYGDPDLYVPALEEGVTVILGHAGTACRLHGRHHRLDRVLELMERFPNAVADVSALTSLTKYHLLGRIPFDRFPGRFLHGSDFPIPPLALPYFRKLGILEAIRLTRHPNPIDVDVVIKRAVGVPQHVFEAPAKLLEERVRAWDARGASPERRGAD